MKFGILLTPGSDSPGLVLQAEEQGYDTAFFVDSPALFGDPWVSMGATAAKTERITLGIGVTNPLTRSSPVTASSLAGLNALAPGRVALGIGVGFTATLAMGMRRARLAELERHITELRQLLSGDESEVDLLGEPTIVQFLRQEQPWINLQDRIPFYVAAANPNSLEMAGRVADAVILGGVTQPDVIDTCRELLDVGAKKVGRRADDIEVTITPSVLVTDGELSFEELQTELGPKSMAPAMNFSRIASMSTATPESLKQEWDDIRHAYRGETGGATDPRRKHLTTYRNYVVSLEDWQRPYVTQSVLDGTSIAGTPEQCLAKIAMLERHGVGHILMSPHPARVGETIEAYGRKIFPRVK